MKKKISFYSCSNGLGHFSRILKICESLSKNFDITIYCEEYQYNKFKPNLEANFIFYKFSNIRWDKALKYNDICFDQYKKWIDFYGPTTLDYDIVVSDNITGLLKYRDDIILSGSFLWADVFKDKFGDNKLSELDFRCLDLFNPLILTNKYVETGSIKEYKNKIRFGWGCADKEKNIWGKSDTVVLGKPSLNYITTYEKAIKEIKDNLLYKTSSNISKDSKCTFLIRPGVGMLTHCIENYIPVIALYDESDSIEIVELAKRVEDLGIGTSINIQKEFDISKIFINLDNTIYNKLNFEKEGYKNIANFLNNK
tara:strand:+ start:892 stop:1824 length:933 start_codon:yes stop_codon:yes gene_type:complete